MSLAHAAHYIPANAQHMRGWNCHVTKKHTAQRKPDYDTERDSHFGKSA